jgi:hypothetical protein
LPNQSLRAIGQGSLNAKSATRLAPLVTLEFSAIAL